MAGADESRKGGRRRFVCGVREGKSESLKEILMCIIYIKKYQYTYCKIEPTHNVFEAPFIDKCIKDKPMFYTILSL